MKILLIEDDKVMLKTLKSGLENLQHHVFAAESCEDAMKLAKSEKFDVILSDIMLPGISGLSLVNVLRSVDLDNTPIIMMSVLYNEALINAAFEAGANDFLQKPFSMEEISEKLRKYDKTLK